MISFAHLRFAASVFVFIVLCVFSCKEDVPDELFYKNAEVLDIKRDDEGEYHLLIRYKDGTVDAIADVGCAIKTGNYKPSCKMPFVTWHTWDKSGTLKAWTANSTGYSDEDILVYLPLNHNIPLFND